MNTSFFESDSFTQLLPVLKKLQEQKAISQELFNVNQYPNIKIMNEMIEKLFGPLKDHNINTVILGELLGVENVAEACVNLNKKLSEMQVMKFSQLILYKVLPCSNSENCEHLPREIATNNQYYDKELACPFYHHYRDQRRLCISNKLQEEFIYQANYYDEEKLASTKDNYSQNYFESMFHPLYYKMFQCTRKYCKAAPYCPFYHTEQEKRIWGEYFLTFVNKERVAFVKEKKRSLLATEDSSVSPRNDAMQKSPKSDYSKSSGRSDFIRTQRQEYIKSPKYEMARKVFDKYTKPYNHNVMGNSMMTNNMMTNNMEDYGNERYVKYDYTNGSDGYRAYGRYEGSHDFEGFAAKGNGNKRQIFVSKRVSKEIRVN